MKDKKNISQQLAKLDEIVKYFEDSNKDFDLDNGLAKYDEAISLVKSVKEELGSYELRIKEIQKKYAGDSDES
jgi:exodeoxyribonuclease VII small subunit